MLKLLPLILLLTLAMSPAAQTHTLTGWIVTVYGDPLPNSDPITLVLLQNANGTNLARLEIDSLDALPYIGREVQVEGVFSGQTAAAGQSIPVMEVIRITDAMNRVPTETSTAFVPPGNYPWVNLLCQFADIPTWPYTEAHYTRLFSDTAPGIGQYWREISEERVNITGTQTVFPPFVLPHPNSHYLNAGGANLSAMLHDCTAAADASVNFAAFAGVNLLFNGEVGAAGWGGQHIFALDGESRMLRVTWMPPRGHTHALIAHEMGHAWGLPHSSGPAHDPPSGRNIYVSAWDVMSQFNGTCNVSDEALGCLGPGTIGFYTRLLGWLPDSRVQNIDPGGSGIVTLERLRLTQNPASTVLVIVPIANSSSIFYTVEVRDLSGYDRNVPGQAVIIHRVDLDMPTSTNTGPALVVDSDTNRNVNDAGAMWTVGEVFYDAAADIEIAVIEVSEGSYTVRVRNNAPAAEIILPVAPELPTFATPTPPFLLTPPVLSNIDGGGLDWSATGGWVTSPAANFTGAGGLGWQITGNSPGLYPLQWAHQFSLAGISWPRLSFMYRMSETGSVGRVQVRTPGRSWTTLTQIAPAADWQMALIDLSEYRGRVVELRLVWNSDSSDGGTWQVDNVYLFNGENLPPPGVTIEPQHPNAP